jgi:ATP-binding cassette subfamily F protein uup
MLDRLATQVLGLDGKGGAHFVADYSQWERVREAQERPEPAKSKSPQPAAKEPVKRLSYEEQKELSRIEERIEAAERKVEAIQQQLSDPVIAADHVKLQQCWAEVQAAQERVAERKAELTRLDRQNARLQQQLALSDKDAFIEREARRLGLVRPGERLFIVKGVEDLRRASLR